MPTYTIKLWSDKGEFEETVFVPKTVKGLRNVADYICRKLAKNYAQATVVRRLSPLKHEPERGIEEYREIKKGAQDNYYDTHIDAITEALEDLLERIRR